MFRRSSLIARKQLLFWIASFFLSGCLSAIQPIDSAPASVPALGPGAARVDGLHFQVQGYDRLEVESLLENAERDYEHLMQDTALYSFRPREHYPIVLFATKEEYLQKTGLPSWSGGATIGSTLYLFKGAGLERTLAHEMTHLIFNEYMGDQAAYRLRWLNEGLATMQERNTMDQGQRASLDQFIGGTLRNQGLPIEQVVGFAPASEQEREISLWYNQVESLTRFLIERGGRLNFAQFLEELRRGRTLDQAMSYAFDARFPDLATLERTWKASLP